MTAARNLQWPLKRVDHSITMPLHTVSEANQRGHWAKHAKRHAEHRGFAEFVTHKEFRWLKAPYVIWLTRIAPRKLDSDNLQGSLKYVRDGIAKGLGIDDGDARLHFEYAQERGRPKEYGVRVEMCGD